MNDGVGDNVDTIVALATPAAPALRAIVRMSGPRAVEIAERVTSGILNPEFENDEDPYPLPEYRAAALSLAGLVVPGNVLTFHAPRSATGENVVEFHLPGSPWIVSTLLEHLFTLGARQAEPGEFTSRAFFNGKLDLASAEGVVATIAASNRAGLAAARQLLSGELSNRLNPLMSRLADALALVEVGIDFSEENVTFIARERLLATIDELRRTLANVIEHSSRFERLDHEPRIVLAGRPNAGKSSLLNALAGKSRAIVADVEGTTRDALSERVALTDGFITLVDVAGLTPENADAEQTRFAAIDAGGSRSISVQTQQTAEDEIARADLLVLVTASDDDRPPLRLSRKPDLVVISKNDLLPSLHSEAVPVSVRSMNGLDALREALNASSFTGGPVEQTEKLALNTRHRRAIGDAISALDRARTTIDLGAEITAAELRAALDDLGQVLGRIAPDEVLGRIFSGFCIGK